MKQNNIFTRVYKIVRGIPEGKVMTYGEVAKIVATSPRVVGFALHANTEGSGTPCHRVVNKEGRLAPGFAFGGEAEQRMRLKSEGVVFKDDRHVDLARRGLAIS